jgi:hypothetical protein
MTNSSRSLSYHSGDQSAVGALHVEVGRLLAQLL